jgi:hypothetical protein
MHALEEAAYFGHYYNNYLVLGIFTTIVCSVRYDLSSLATPMYTILLLWQTMYRYSVCVHADKKELGGAGD